MNALPICIDLSREQKERGARRTLTGRNYRTPFVQASRNVAKVDSKLVSMLFLTRRRFVIDVEQTVRPHNSFRKTISEDDRKKIRFLFILRIMKILVVESVYKIFPFSTSNPSFIEEETYT